MVLSCYASAKNAARLCAGQFADIVAMLGNPLQDVESLRKINFVIKNGKGYAARNKPEICATRETPEARAYGSSELSSGVALLFPGVAIGVVAVALPEAEAVSIEQHETARPLDTFPGIEMGND
jgi:hypothetical protein